MLWYILLSNYVDFGKERHDCPACYAPDDAVYDLCIGHDFVKSGGAQRRVKAERAMRAPESKGILAEELRDLCKA